MKTATLYESNGRQMILLPKEFEFNGVSKVYIAKKGGSLIISPNRKSWTSFSEVDKASSDFLSNRKDIIK